MKTKKRMVINLFGYLYKIKNKINNKVYIGKTYNTIYQRYQEHIENAFKKKEDTKLYNDMRKYGIENFEIILLGQYEEYELEYQEIEEIKKHNSWKEGYNQSAGGEGLYKNQERDKNIIFDFKNNHLSIDKLSKKYKTTKNIIHKILYRNNVQDYINSLKPIAMFDENGDYIKTFSCLIELIEITGYDSKIITSCLNDKYKTYNGLSFSYNLPF